MAKDEYTLELFLTWYSFNQTVALCEPANQPVSGGTFLHFLFKVKWEYFKTFLSVVFRDSGMPSLLSAPIMELHETKPF